MRLLKAMHETERFSSTEQNIVDYILAHPAEIADLTTRELAEKTVTSPAAVFRLCQKLGLKGYNEFKLKFISEVNRVGGHDRVRRKAFELDAAREQLFTRQNKLSVGTRYVEIFGHFSTIKKPPIIERLRELVR